MSFDENVVQAFEKKVLNGLKACGVNLENLSKEHKSIGAAVSGGADSISLLVSLERILHEYKIPLKVITVNHNIRPKEETDGDAQFVVSKCRELESKGGVVSCTVKELKPGEVQELASQSKTGLEAAARDLRYHYFDEFILEEKLAFLCLAHNQNDQLETVLMRFLQGARVDSMAGIPLSRGKIVRPMLGITRAEIEGYLAALSQSWRTDLTNFDTAYKRNHIRQKLVPFLNEEFPDWQKNILSGAQKAAEDSLVLAEKVNGIEIKENNGSVEIAAELFDVQKPAVQKRIILKACNILGVKDRIPEAFLQETVSNKNGVKQWKNIEISFKKGVVLVKKASKIHTEIVFSDIIEESGSYDFPFGKVDVIPCNKSSYYSLVINDCPYEMQFTLPVCIRSANSTDTIKAADGTQKKVTDIFSDWHIEEALRGYVPVIQELSAKEQNLICILASFMGFKDWIVK